MRTLWSPAVYWPVWLAATLAAFGVREVWALASRHPGGTLSDWVWRVLKVAVNKPISDWSAGHFLVFGAWLVLVAWLTLHFFFRRFT